MAGKYIPDYKRIKAKIMSMLKRIQSKFTDLKVTVLVDALRHGQMCKLAKNRAKKRNDDRAEKLTHANTV